MGLCGSSEAGLTPEEKQRRAEERERNKALEAEINSDHVKDSQINKLLLLGAGESGKSTLFKQMITIYGKGFPLEERKNFTSIIYNNVITAMKILCKYSEQFGAVSEENKAAKELVDNLKGDEDVDKKLGTEIKKLWVDPGIKATYEQRSQYQFPDSGEYFFSDRLDEIMKDGYIPSEQDVLRSRVRTTGIVENDFIIDGNAFKMFDVGGQRNERKKWIHCFENVTAVLFVAAISEYDQVLFEDETTNRIVEALNLFEEICNSRWFRETAMILFLNKRDLFGTKIVKVPINKFFPEYTGGADYNAGCKFMTSSFTNRNRNKDKPIYTHVTCATDTGNVSAVFNAVKDIIIRKSLGEAGLM